jgi:hypothetical protein
VARVAVGLDSGLQSYPATDPVVLADISGNGALSGLDAQRIAQIAVGLTPPEIPSPPGPQRLDTFAQLWEGEAPAEPHSGSVIGSAGASSSRRSPPGIPQKYLGVSQTSAISLAEHALPPIRDATSPGWLSETVAARNKPFRSTQVLSVKPLYHRTRPPTPERVTRAERHERHGAWEDDGRVEFRGIESRIIDAVFAAGLVR